jgi:hypothetical protein
MAYVAPPRGGATRDYYSVPKVGIKDPTEIDPTKPYQGPPEANQYASITDPIFWGLGFFLLYRIINKLNKPKQ